MRALAPDLAAISARTLAHYEAHADAFREGTGHHDVSQNYAAFLRAIEGVPPFGILDLGCGPGRDVAYFRSLGHDVVGLDGAARFVEMARRLTGCEVLHQDFLELSLRGRRFDGVFANASLFHVPTSELGRVLAQLRAALAPRGVLFSSNPRGHDADSHVEGFTGDRFGAFHTLEGWRAQLVGVGFEEIEHYYRPEGKPREQQPWLASVWRKSVARPAAFAAGACLFDASLFWDAHEAWEERWRIETDEAPRRFFQGFIQIAAGLHKLIAAGSPESASRLFAKGLEKLEGTPAALEKELAIDVAAFRARVAAFAAALDRGEVDAARGLALGAHYVFGAD